MVRGAGITEWPLVQGRLRLRTSFPARRYSGISGRKWPRNGQVSSHVRAFMCLDAVWDGSEGRGHGSLCDYGCNVQARVRASGRVLEMRLIVGGNHLSAGVRYSGMRHRIEKDHPPWPRQNSRPVPLPIHVHPRPWPCVTFPASVPNFTVVAMTDCAALPAPAWESCLSEARQFAHGLRRDRRRLPLSFALCHPAETGLSLRRKKKRTGFVTPTETNVHGDALCSMVKTWAGHKTTETELNSGSRLAVGGPWGLS